MEKWRLVVMEIDILPILERTCDLCNGRVTDENHKATRSFVLTDWGVICIRCWDDRMEGHGEFEILKVYITSQRVDDEWIGRPLVFTGFSPDGHPREGDAPDGED